MRSRPGGGTFHIEDVRDQVELEKVEQVTMRNYRYFVCPNGHRGEEKTSENDQPYSTNWERVEIKGMWEGKDDKGRRPFFCDVCDQQMQETAKP